VKELLTLFGIVGAVCILAFGTIVMAEQMHLAEKSSLVFILLTLVLVESVALIMCLWDRR